MGEEFEFIAQIFGLIPPPDSPVSVEVTHKVSHKCEPRRRSFGSGQLT